MARPKIPEELRKKHQHDYMRQYMRDYRKRQKEQTFSEILKKTAPAPRSPMAKYYAERQV
jgi:hypothetical protein